MAEVVPTPKKVGRRESGRRESERAAVKLATSRCLVVIARYSGPPMRTPLAPIGLFAFALAVASCSSSDPYAGLTNPGCRKLAEAVCSRLAACSPFLLARDYGDEATCVTRTNNGCGDALAAPNEAATSDDMGRCSTGVSGMSCDALFSWNLEVLAHRSWTVLGNPESYSRCPPRYGPRPSGTACSADSQCNDAYCQQTVVGECGKCRSSSTSSNSCTTTAECGPNDWCAPTGKCLKLLTLEHSCSSTFSCVPGSFCEYTKCVPIKSVKGDPCDDKAACDVTKGLVCGASKTCEEVTLANPGEACGGLVACRAGGTCTGGTCVAYVAKTLDPATCK